MAAQTKSKKKRVTKPITITPLTVEQRRFVIGLLARGFTTPQINKRAALFEDPFHITPNTACIMRRENKLNFSKLVSEGKMLGLAEGLAKKEERVRLLQELAYELREDLLHKEKKERKIWLRRLKGYGQGVNFFTQPFFEFNQGEIQQLRGVLDDIAKELGQRAKPDDKILGAGEETKDFQIPADALASSFIDVYRDIRDRKHMEYLLKGGRGSTKSSFTSLVIIYLLITNPGIHAAVMRQVANTLRDSVYSQLVWAIGFLGLSDKFKCITSPLEIEYLPTHQKIYFRGADKPEMIKSIKPTAGYIAILWFEELDQFHGPEAIRKIEQSVLRGGEEAWEFKTYNPPKTAANWVNKYIQIPKASQFQHHSTYLSVPPEWLGQTFINEAEHLRDVNPPAYEHEHMGIVTGTGGLVFENTVLQKITDEEIAQFDHVLHGLDWGYFPDPFCYGRMHYDAARLTLYIFDEYRVNKRSNRLVYRDLVKRGLKSSDLIIADSAEPKSIADFREYGANIRGAEKGPDSVDYSIKWLQSLKAIIIDLERAPYHAEEFLNYELEQDKDGEFISAYPDRNNHAIDDVRYATNLIWRKRGQ